MKFMKHLEPLSLLAVRMVAAIIFIYHGYPKLLHPTEALYASFESHDLPRYFVSVAGILEFFGGLLLLVGFLTRPAALLLAIEMGVAIWKIHSVHGVMAVKEYEFPLILAASCFVLATVGAGLLSLDHLLFGCRSSKGFREKRRFAKAG
jgi:putative oxidoreductase